eukprot:4511553-Pleurochrysis_carterae.AAC.1
MKEANACEGVTSGVLAGEHYMPWLVQCQGGLWVTSMNSSAGVQRYSEGCKAALVSDLDIPLVH